MAAAIINTSMIVGLVLFVGLRLRVAPSDVQSQLIRVSEEHAAREREAIAQLDSLRREVSIKQEWIREAALAMQDVKDELALRARWMDEVKASVEERTVDRWMRAEEIDQWKRFFEANPQLQQVIPVEQQK